MLLLSLIPKRPLLQQFGKTKTWRYLSYRQVNNGRLYIPFSATQAIDLQSIKPTRSYMSYTRLYSTGTSPGITPRGEGETPASKVSETGEKVGEDKKTKRQESRNKLTRILREYGSVAIIFHTSMSLCVLGVCYMIVKSGVDVENFLKYFKIDSSRYSTASTFAVSYIIYKILLPIRATITVTCVPLIVRSLRARGWMKTPPNSSQLPTQSTPKN